MAMEKILSEPPAVSKGDFLYSNNGYVIAGHMEEKVAGKPWEQLIKEALFIPLNMSSAGFGPPGSSQSIDQPRGHDDKGNPVSPDPLADNPASMGPAGTAHMSIIDWAKFINLHLQAARGNPCLLTAASFKKLQQPIDNPPPPYAMGWIVEDQDWAKGKVLLHAGSNQLWYAKVWIAPKLNLAIFVALNSGEKEAVQAANDVGLALLKIQLQHPNLKAIDSSLK
jgi:D-alanyl-D-alanine carboxypeptidase